MPPSDALAIAVTTGLGVSVIAGILSGICYILNHGVPRKRQRKPGTPWHCMVCQNQFRSIQGVLEVEKVVTCAKCNGKVCRVKCSVRDPQRGWICRPCQQPETWFNGLLKAINPNSTKGWYSAKMDSDAIDELDEDLLELRKKEREQVRDFIERLVESMLGGNLDEVSVSRLYNDKKYLPITGQSPCTAHASLKLLIQRFIREAVELPELKRQLDHPALPEPQQGDRTYEDLLSTAIINKVVENYQNETPPPRSSENSVSSRASASTKKEYFFSEETLDAKWRHKIGQDDTSSVSSFDSSVGSLKYTDRVSLTIKQQIHEVSSSEDESPIDAEDAWSDNWFLQKRITGSHSPVPVPMLVPNPTVEAKVFIGDKEAEDTSDLSDACSDFGDTEVVPDIKNILVNSRTIIGGKNILDNPVVEDITVNNVEEVVSHEKVLVEAKVGLDLKVEDASLLSLDSNTEQDTEYTEQYASLPRTILKSPKPTPRASKLTDIFKNETVDETDHVQDKVVSDDDNGDGDVSDASDNSEQKLQSFKGSYSEREKEKWKHAVEMPNNPYTMERLETRLSNRSSDDSVSPVFGRDYYIREAAKSAGARKKVDQPASFDLEPLVYTNGDNDDVDEKQSDSVTITALPAHVEPEDETTPSTLPTPKWDRFPSTAYIQPEEDPIETSPPIPKWDRFPTTRPNHTVEMSSDSDMSIERIYNLESGKVIQKVGHVSQEIVADSTRSLEGIRYTAKEDLHFRRAIDENHNDTTGMQAKKREFLRSLTEDESATLSIGDDLEETTTTTGDLEADLTFNEEVRYDVPYTPVALNEDAINKFSAVLEMAEPNCFGEMKKLVDNKSVKTSDYSEEDVLSENKDFSLEYSTDVGDHESASPMDSLMETDPEIIDLKEKRLVQDVLGKFSKSFPNLSAPPPKKPEEQIKTVVVDDGSVSPEPLEMPSVRNLKKLFDKSNSVVQPKKQDQKQVHSLTARSIPRQFRQDLKSHEEKSMSNEDLRMNGSNEETVGEDELPSDIARNRIAFFEQLKRK